MRNKIIIAIAAAGLMTGCATREPEPHMAELKDLPKPVQQTIREQAPYGDISRVETHKYEGKKAIYDVSFHNSAANPDMRVASDGTLLSGGRAAIVVSEPAGAVYTAPRALRVGGLATGGAGFNPI